MHLLVIGGNGFIGSHFVAEAIDAGHRVTVVGRQGAKPAYQHGRPFDFYAGGIAELVGAKTLLKSADVVCHFASSTTPASAEADPQRDRRENLEPMAALLQVMHSVGPNRLIYLSSGGAVYGTPKVSPIPESHPLNPIGAYGTTKLAAENLIIAEAIRWPLRSLVVRPSNPYGLGQPAKAGSGVIPAFLLAAHAGQPVTLFSNGTIVRDFIHVTDLVRFLLLAVYAEVVGTLNVGAGVGTSLLQLLGIIERATGKTVARRFLPARPFDPPEIVLDISKAKGMTGWRPEISLDEGIRKILQAVA